VGGVAWGIKRQACVPKIVSPWYVKPPESAGLRHIHFDGSGL
jgi:hypothetical protein